MNKQNSRKTVVIIDDDLIFCEAVKDFLENELLQVLIATTAQEGLAVCSFQKVDVVLLDQQLPDAEGNTLCPEILKSNDQTKIIFATAYPSFASAVTALKSGAYDYLVKPFELAALRLAVDQALRTLELEQFEQLQNYQRTREREEAIFIGGEGLAGTMRLVERAALSASPVLITGETGTGKTLAAKTIHYRSPLAQAPFISINCAALPESLIEAELFGYEKGAFTGAIAARKGIFEMADGGTLFLDEIGEMPLHLQTKLLSVIEDKLVRKIGGAVSRPVDVRVIAATGTDLNSALGKTFRNDLYYRLSVIQIHLPPLRERRGDIPGLCSHLLTTLTGNHGKTLPDEELQRLTAYGWPGNVRELKNVLERAVILQHDSALRPSSLLVRTPQPLSPTLDRELPAEDERLTLEAVENKHIQYTLKRLGGNYTRTAKALGISLSTLKRKLKNIPPN